MITIPTTTINQNAHPIASNFQKSHDENFVDIEEEIQAQPVAISVGQSEYKGKMYPVALGSFGDFSCIVGASKGRKTFLKSLIIACGIGGNSNLFSSSIKGHDMKGKYIIDIDTEQSKFHSLRVFRRVAEMVGYNPDNYKPFSLRSMSADERFAFIDWIFTKSQYVGNIGLVSIDGIADLVNDINDLEASNKVTQKLLEWSANEKCHIITILHRNFGTKKPTGHLGSAVLKKAETVIFVEPGDNDFVKVVPEYTRNQPFKEFSFGVNKDWLPYVVEDELPKSFTKIEEDESEIGF